ncbi:MAG: hypothetical protein L3K26_00595 [Candidatus Hydrogenedentes bacterium]|nr:hypothetical protein [Candidatus Hydrogenedentota bacterium]
MDETTLFPDFESSDGGAYLSRDGQGRKPDIPYSKKKLCFVATDLHVLTELLLDLSHRDDCYFVKFSIKARDGMYLGRCFLLEDTVAGELWKRYKVHPKLMCSIQDDDFTAPFRDLPKAR